MKLIRSLLLSIPLGLASLGALPGEASARALRSADALRAPPPRPELPPGPPATTRHVWVGGHWQWSPTLRTHVWQPGRWVVQTVAPPPPVYQAPRVRNEYVRPHWRWTGRTYRWIGGHWETRRGAYEYVHPHWDYQGGRWFFVQGYWHRG
jgi:hypothetical protein